MDKDKYKKLAIRLGMLWIISVVVLLCLYYGVSSYIAQMRDVDTVTIFAQYADILMWVWMVVFVPMLFFIQRFCRKAEMKQWALISRILFIHQAVCGGILVCVRMVGVILSFIR